MPTLREEIRDGTLRRMRRALADTEDRLATLRDERRSADDPEIQQAAAWRAALIRDIQEMER
ncbi:MAG: hypothetical protein INR70_26745 [Parafilimonas terrae]|nr:hypothetical protein [Parafilimonas terrae]